MTSFTLGINTCFAVKRWPRPEDWGMVVTGDLGLTVVQHSLDLVDLEMSEADRADQARWLRSTCETFGLELHSTFTGLAAYSSNLLLHPDASWRSRAEAWYRRAIDFTAAAGGRATGGHLGAYSVADRWTPERHVALSEELRGALERLTRYAKRAGLDALYVENMASIREPATMADVASLLDSGDDQHAAVQLCLDVGHQCVPGTSGADRDPYVWLAAFGRHAGIVQLQQSDAHGDHHWPFTAANNAVGRIDARRVIDVLSATGAETVTLILEVIPPFETGDADVLRDLVASVDHWRSALAKA